MRRNTQPPWMPETSSQLRSAATRHWALSGWAAISTVPLLLMALGARQEHGQSWDGPVGRLLTLCLHEGRPWHPCDTGSGPVVRCTKNLAPLRRFPQHGVAASLGDAASS